MSPWRIPTRLALAAALGTAAVAPAAEPRRDDGKGREAAAPEVPAALANVDRSIAREPDYQSDSPGYVLLAFGPRADFRAWMVLDGETLYIDRNGNGDLTEPDERVTRDGERAMFSAGDITAANGARHTGLSVGQFEDMVYVNVQVDGRRRQFAGRDMRGQLSPARTPAEAPVVHFGGPLTMGLTGENCFNTREVQHTLYAALIGTPGIGPGTFASISYENVPAGAHPVAEIELPAPDDRDRDRRPIRERVELDQRC